MALTGFWMGRLVRGGPYVPLRVWYGAPLVDGEELDRHHRFQCLVRDETTARAVLYGEDKPVEVEGVQLRNLEPISEPRYRWMLAHLHYVMRHQPGHPEAQPTTPIDWNRQPPAFRRK